MGLAGILYSEIEAWARLTNRTLEKWEIDALRRIDDLYLNSKALQMKADEENSTRNAGQSPKIQIAKH